MEMLDLASRSAIARAVGRCGDAIDRVPADVRTATWLRTHAQPAMEALHALTALIAEVPAPRPRTVSVVVDCPDVSLHVSTPWWNPMAGRVHPKRPGVAMVVAVRHCVWQDSSKLGRHRSSSSRAPTLREAGWPAKSAPPLAAGSGGTGPCLALLHGYGDLFSVPLPSGGGVRGRMACSIRRAGRDPHPALSLAGRGCPANTSPNLRNAMLSSVRMAHRRHRPGAHRLAAPLAAMPDAHPPPSAR
jgi:hypothetical protein